MTKLEGFGEFLDTAIEKGKGIRVFIEMPDLHYPETICNPASNVPAKKDYYMRAYNDNLELKAFTGIRICGFEWYPHDDY
jgi:hypothetical protein